MVACDKKLCTGLRFSGDGLISILDGNHRLPPGLSGSGRFSVGNVTDPSYEPWLTSLSSCMGDAAVETRPLDSK